MVVVASSSSWRRVAERAWAFAVVVVNFAVVAIVDSVTAAVAVVDDDVAPLIFAFRDTATVQSFLDSKGHLMWMWRNGEAPLAGWHCHCHHLRSLWMMLLSARSESNWNFPRCQSWENGLDDRATSVSCDGRMIAMPMPMQMLMPMIQRVSVVVVDLPMFAAAAVAVVTAVVVAVLVWRQSYHHSWLRHLVENSTGRR